MTPEILTFMMFAGLVVGIFIGFPVAFTLSGLAMIIGYIGWGKAVFPLIGYQANAVMSNFEYIAIPLFVFMGCMMESSGAADTAFGVMSQWLRKVKGGLGIASVFVCMLFASCIGVIGASVATLGLIALAPMIDRGYSKSLATGIIASGAGLGVLLPPSFVIILFSDVAQVSIGKLFVGAIAPGLLLGLCYALYAGGIGYIKKDAVPPVIKDDSAPLKYSLPQGLASLVPFAAIVFIVIGAIVFGIAAPTEAAGIGAMGSIAITLAYRKCTKGALVKAAMNTLEISAMIVFVALGARMFTAVLFGIGGSRVIRGFIEEAGLSASATFALAMLLVFLLGIFVDWLGVILILVPIIMPILVGFGFDPLHVSIVILVLLQTSFITPPFAYSIIFLKGVVPPDVSMGDIYRGVVPFIFIQVFVVAVCMIVPAIVTFLPDMAFVVTSHPTGVWNQGFRY